MKFKVSQSDLSSNLSLVSRAVPSRLSHPILANVLVRATGDHRVSLTAFDLSLGIHTSFVAEVEESGQVTLPAKLLGEIISRLPEGELRVSIKFEDEAAIATIKSASGKYTVRGMAADEFPELPEVEAEAIALPTEELLGAIGLTLFSTSSDESKQVLTGVHLTLGHDILECAATDGHRLSVAVQTVGDAEVESAIAPDNAEATIPSKALHELQKVGADTKVIKLVMDERVARFTCGDRVLTTRILEGQYPNYRQLIPRQFARTLVAERRAFLQSLERIAVLADQKNSVVKLSLDADKQELAIAVDAQDVGSGREVVPCQISGDSLDVAFNVKYLLDGLKAASTAEVQMEFNTPTSPAVLSPLGGAKMTYLLMPIHCRD